jgi:hypothetical protein
VLVAHACNPSYSGGRDRRISVQTQPRQIVLKTLSQKKLFTKKRAGGVAQGVGPEFKTPVTPPPRKRPGFKLQYHQKEKENFPKLIKVTQNRSRYHSMRFSDYLVGECLNFKFYFIWGLAGDCIFYFK